jgi:hypothetical protein
MCILLVLSAEIAELLVSQKGGIALHEDAKT